MKFYGKFINEKIAIEPSKISQNLKYRRRHPNLQQDKQYTENLAQQKRSDKRIRQGKWYMVVTQTCQHKRRVRHGQWEVVDTKNDVNIQSS
jgi:hypothetical protein